MPAAASVQEGVFAADAPPLIGEGFLSEWSQWTVGDLFKFLTTEMPPELTERREVIAEYYADIIAFNLEKSRYPAGQSELAADFESPGQIELSP